jgi:predicted hotdog family 3-hydroxylacyl-ACP dehydratase
MIDVDIEKILPHRDRMKLIDEVLEVEDKKAVTASTVSEKWPLFHDNAVNPIILVELVAQTTGIGVGHKRLQETGKGVYGWIVGIKHANFSDKEIPLGTRLINRIWPMYEHESYAVFKGTVENASTKEILCEMEVQVYSPE